MDTKIFIVFGKNTLKNESGYAYSMKPEINKILEEYFSELGVEVTYVEELEVSEYISGFHDAKEFFNKCPYEIKSFDIDLDDVYMEDCDVKVVRQLFDIADQYDVTDEIEIKATKELKGYLDKK